MSRCKGIPTYTQASVAWSEDVWKIGERKETLVDEIGISFDAHGGGTNGDFRFCWRAFTNERAWSSPAVHGPYLKIEVYTDGLAAFLDERIQKVIVALRRRGDVTPAQLIKMLEEAGVRPSIYHLQGERPLAGYQRTLEIDKRIKKLRRHWHEDKVPRPETT